MLVILQLQSKAHDAQRLENLLQKAQNLLTALAQWQENLLKVGQFLVEHQQAFLHSQDSLDLIATPQQIIAQSVGLSDATVSRIVRGRYLLLHCCAVAPLLSIDGCQNTLLSFWSSIRYMFHFCNKIEPFLK